MDRTQIKTGIAIGLSTLATNSVMGETFDNVTQVIDDVGPIFTSVFGMVILLVPLLVVLAVVGFVLGLFDGILGGIKGKLRGI